MSTKAPNLNALVIKEPEQVKLAELKFSPFNPRHMPAEKMAALKASILKHGMVLNLVVQRVSEAHGPMVIIGGHQRVRAMREVCAERKQPIPKAVWAVVLDVDDATAGQLNIALNRIDGEFDAAMLGTLLAQCMTDPNFDALATGFADAEVAELVRLASTDPNAEAAELEASINDLDGFAKSITLTLEFDTVERRDQARDLLRAMAGEQKAGVALTELLIANAASKPKANGAKRPQRAVEA